MLKLVYKPTGIIFTLPDEEALKIKERDRAGDYKILDAGYTEKVEEKVEPTIMEMLIQEDAEKTEEQEEEDDKEEEKEVLLDKMSKPELIATAERLGLKVTRKDTIAKLKEMIIATGKLN